MIAYTLGKVMTKELLNKLYGFMVDEARSCSMDFGCITPEYVFRSWGGAVALEDIMDALRNIRTEYDYR